MKSCEISDMKKSAGFSKRVLYAWDTEFLENVNSEQERFPSYQDKEKKFEWSTLGKRYASILDGC